MNRGFLHPATTGLDRGAIASMNQRIIGPSREHEKSRHCAGRRSHKDKSLFHNIVSGIDSSLKARVRSLHNMTGIAVLWRLEGNTPRGVAFQEINRRVTSEISEGGMNSC
jgi:hypothetical protein